MGDPPYDPIEYDVVIHVVPKVAEVEFMPDVNIGWGENTGSGSHSGTSLAHVIAELGTWTWSTAGSPDWQWDESLNRGVHLQGYSGDTGEPENDIWLRFGTHYIYTHDEDTFENQEVPGNRGWATTLFNRLGGPEGVITSATVGLETGMEFTSYTREGLVTDPPPPYEWSYDGIGPGVEIHTDVGFQPYDPSPVPFVPGYNMSRTFDVTRFDAPGYQELTIEVTPQDGMPPWFGIHVYIPQDIPFTAYIESCDGANDYHISPDGQRLGLSENFEEYPQEIYNYTIIIRVEPGAHPVEFWPDVEILTFLQYG